MTGLVARRAVREYARRPLNLALLVIVPVVIVFVWGGTLSDFSRLLGGTADSSQIEAATAGWAAAALAGLAGFFQITNSRAADRRLAASAGKTRQVVGGRLAASFGLAVLAAAGGLLALAVRTGIHDPVRVVATTITIAVIYLAIGVLVGTTVQSEMNGALIVTLAWVFDVFFGPGLGSGTAALTRIFPLHYPTLVVIGRASGHAGPLGDVGWSVAWAIALGALAVWRLVSTIRPAPAPRGATATVPVADAVGPATTPEPPRAPAAAPPRRPPLVAVRGDVSAMTRIKAVLLAGSREYRRNRVLWVLLVVVPAIFVGLAIAVTIDEPGRIDLVEGGRHFATMLSERRMHAATMVPIASAFLAGLTGLFIVTGSAGGDGRLALAGFRPGEILAGRLGIIGVATVVTTAIAVAVSTLWYAPEQLVVFAAANLLIALTYAMLGVLVGPLTGRLGGLYLLLLLAFIDVGLGQTVMFPSGPPAWGAFLPARGASKALIDAAFTARFDQLGYLALGLAWLAAFTMGTVAVFRRRLGVAGR